MRLGTYGERHHAWLAGKRTVNVMFFRFCVVILAESVYIVRTSYTMAAEIRYVWLYRVRRIFNTLGSHNKQQVIRRWGDRLNFQRSKSIKIWYLGFLDWIEDRKWKNSSRDSLNSIPKYYKWALLLNYRQKFQFFFLPHAQKEITITHALPT